MEIQMQLEVILPETSTCEAETTKESIKTKTETENWPTES